MKKPNWLANVCRVVFISAVIFLSNLSFSQISKNAESVPMPVSINALMVTLIDHSAHYVWDYGSLAEERDLSDEEWLIVEYYGVQLGASGPLITLGGTGALDDTWSTIPEWIRYSNDLSDAAVLAIQSAATKDRELLSAAGSLLVDSCEGCHDHFKPELPTEGFIHNPEYDHLYHLIRSTE